MGRKRKLTLQTERRMRRRGCSTPSTNLMKEECGVEIPNQINVKQEIEDLEVPTTSYDAVQQDIDGQEWSLKTFQYVEVKEEEEEEEGDDDDDKEEEEMELKPFLAVDVIPIGSEAEEEKRLKEIKKEVFVDVINTGNSELQLAENHHTKDEEKHFDSHGGKCSVKSNVPEKKETAKVHQKRNGQYKCDSCLKSFKYFISLKEHKKLHTGERPYQCPLCKKQVHWLKSFKRHMRLHLQEASYKCEICSKGFKQYSDLKKHLRNHSNETPYKCKICDDKFKQPMQLKRHMKAHAEGTRFQCETCGKGFDSLKLFQSHVKSHTEPRFKCEACGKGFVQRCFFRYHMFEHLGEIVRQ